VEFNKSLSHVNSSGIAIRDEGTVTYIFRGRKISLYKFLRRKNKDRQELMIFTNSKDAPIKRPLEPVRATIGSIDSGGCGKEISGPLTACEIRSTKYGFASRNPRINAEVRARSEKY
jgi:hypothetical protein